MCYIRGFEPEDCKNVSNGGKRTRYWHKISVDAVRGWTAFLTIAVLAAAGVYGYRLLARHLLDRQVEVAIEEAAELVASLADEEDLPLHRDKWASARSSLDEARTLYDQHLLDEAMRAAQRSRSLLVSIVDSLRHRNPAGEAQFVSTQGGVEVRRGERGDWRPAHSRMVVYTGDYIKTSDQGSAEVMMLDGTLFTVRPGSVVLVDRSRSLTGLRTERTLSLESGWVNLSTSSTGSRVTTPGAEARVEQRSEALVTYDEATSEGRFASYRGQMRIASPDGATRDIGELEQVLQRGAELSAPKTLPEAPVVVAPQDNVQVALARADTLGLRWRPVKGAATYALQVSHNRLFVNNIIDVEGRERAAATLGLKRGGSYVWRVAAVDREGQQGPWSPAHRFRVLAEVGGSEEVASSDTGAAPPRLAQGDESAGK